MGKSTINTYKWPFSIATLNYPWLNWLLEFTKVPKPRRRSFFQRLQAQYSHDENRAKTLVLSNVAARTILCRFYRWLIFSGLFPSEPPGIVRFFFLCLSHTFPHVFGIDKFRRFGIATTPTKKLQRPRYHPDDPNIILSGGWDNTAAWIESIRGFWMFLGWFVMGFHGIFDGD